MQVQFTPISLYLYGKKLAETLAQIIPSLIQVANEYRNVVDDRTLIIVLGCPCCSGHISFDDETYEFEKRYGSDEKKKKLERIWEELWNKSRADRNLFEFLLKTDRAVFVSPLAGIDAPEKVHLIQKYPPYERPDGSTESQTRDLDEYLNLFRETINQALGLGQEKSK